MNSPTYLNETFRYTSDTHRYTVNWCEMGNVTSPPLIFIHGTPWSSRVWEPYALSLSRKFHVYLFDRPGFGDSPEECKLPGEAQSSSKAIELDADLARQTEVFAALFQFWEKDWDNKRCHVIAHDNGGLISLRAHLLHGCCYGSLCLVDVVAIGPFGQTLFKAIGEDPERFDMLPGMAIEGILEAYIRDATFYKLSDEKLQMLKAPWLRDGGRARFIRELCQANFRSTEAVEPRYSEVGGAMPVKVIWAANDKWIPVADAWRLADALKADEVAVIDNAGHLVMFDQGAHLGVELGQWLSPVSASQAARASH